MNYVVAKRQLVFISSFRKIELASKCTYHLNVTMKHAKNDMTN